MFASLRCAGLLAAIAATPCPAALCQDDEGKAYIDYAPDWAIARGEDGKFEPNESFIDEIIGTVESGPSNNALAE